MDRRLAAILVADVVGFSGLMETDEAATLKTLKGHHEDLVEPSISEHKGRIVKLMGDGTLAEFQSIVQAVQCAVDIQRAMAARNADVPKDVRIEFRIGINFGDVMAEGDDIYGDGVNIAARLEGLADPGGVCVSRAVRREVRDKLPLEFEDLGEQQVKNIARPVHAYRILVGETFPVKKPRIPRRLSTPSQMWFYGIAAILLLLVLAGALFLRQSSLTEEGATPSIAVLPFNNQSGNSAEEYFSDGLTEDIITALSRYPDLLILSRTAVFTFKGSKATPKQISTELGVRYLVDGSVRKVGERVRVSARLTDAKDGVLLWSEKFDENMVDIFSLQDKVTHKVVGTLVGRLNLVEEQRALAKPTQDLEAYDLALRGRSYFHEGERSANFKARELFASAIKHDPDYASAYTWLARTYLNDAVFGWSQWPRKSLQRSFELAQQSINLDDTSGMSHALLAEIYTYSQRYDLAANAAKRAMALNPNHADGHAILGLISIFNGEVAEAIPLLETARRFNPEISPDWSNMLGIAYFLQKRYDDAIGLLEGLCVQFPEFAYSYVALAAVYGELGNTSAAEAAVEKLRDLAPFFDPSGFSQQYLNQAHRARFTEALRSAGL